MTETKLLQPNQISRAAYKCDCTERKILFYAALQVQKARYRFCDVSMSGYVARFKISEMLKALSMENTTSNRNNVKAAIHTIARNTITVNDTEDKLTVINWLQQGDYDAKTNTIELVFTDSIGRMFCECREQFSELSPIVIGSLKSYYAMRYYELALSFRGFTPWEYTLTLDQLRNMYQIDSYTDAKDGTNNFIRKVIMAPIEELNANNPDFKITAEKIQDLDDKRRISAIKFTCKAYGASKREKINPGDSPARKRTKKIQNEIADIIEERKPVEAMQSKHPEEFEERLKKVRKDNPILLEAVAKQVVFEQMAKEGF